MAYGSSIIYSGYFEAIISLQFLSSFNLNVPILLIPDNDINMSCPVVKGKNVLRRCKYFIQNSDVKTEDIPEQWTLAMQGIYFSFLLCQSMLT